jgi:hypothetical protein
MRKRFHRRGELLLCVKGDPVSVWQHLDDLQRPVQIWFTYGPEATLTASDVLPAERRWVGFAGNGHCTEEQTPNDGGPPVSMPDELMDFPLIPNLATLRLKGACDWRIVGTSPLDPRANFAFAEAVTAYATEQHLSQNARAQAKCDTLPLERPGNSRRREPADVVSNPGE